jgi:hypothetical protein
VTYTLSLHDALPIEVPVPRPAQSSVVCLVAGKGCSRRGYGKVAMIGPLK